MTDIEPTDEASVQSDQPETIKESAADPLPWLICNLRQKFQAEVSKHSQSKLVQPDPRRPETPQTPIRG